MSTTDIIAIVALVLSSGTVVALITKLKTPAATLGLTASHFMTGELDRVPASPGLRAALHHELGVLAADADSDTMTVEQAATTLLAKVAPQFPQASYTDVIAVVGAFTHAFVGGLADPTPAPVVVAAKPA